MTDKELLEMIAVKVSSMDTKLTVLDSRLTEMDSKLINLDSRLTNMDARLKKVETDLDEVKRDVKRIDHTVVLIENKHGEKLSALFDGYKQHTEQLDRIEKAVIEHDKMLFKQAK